MKPLWFCAACGCGIHAYTNYVVLLFSWSTDHRDHLCGECWDVIMLSAQAALKAVGVDVVVVD